MIPWLVLVLVVQIVCSAEANCATKKHLRSNFKLSVLFMFGMGKINVC